MKTEKKANQAPEERYLYAYGIISLKDLKPQKHKNQRFLAPENSKGIKDSKNFGSRTKENLSEKRFSGPQKSKIPAESKNDGDFLGFNFNGLKEKPISIIPYEDIGVLVSNYPFLRPILDEKEALEHADILKKIALKTNIIPMAFGSVFKDEETLKIVVEKSYNAIKTSLEQIENKIELGVKLIKNNTEENSIKNEDSIIPEILNPLNNLSAKSIQGENFSERLLLNHSFLVEKNNFSKFSNAIAKLEKKYKEFKFIYTGPWPPYSFVNIHIMGQK